MKIKTAPNQTEITLSNGDQILYSYETPVAARIAQPDGECRFLKTRKNWSVTTSKHINAWLDGVHADMIDQDELTAYAEKI